MTEMEIKDVLCSILAMMKEQAIYLHRQHGWLIAVADTVETNRDLDAFLKKHPFYDLGPRRDIEITHDAIERIDALIQRLKR
jgi:hypothetical protein